jgi:UDP-glucose 6-dehydrogenase
MIKEKNPAIFKQLFHIEENDDPFATDENLSLPLIKIDSATKTLTYKMIKFDSTQNKLKFLKGDSMPLAGSDYSAFLQSSVVLNSNFTEMTKELETAFKKYKTSIGGELNSFITANFSSLLSAVAKKICVPPVEDMTFVDKETVKAIKEELYGLKIKNIFV